MAPGFYFSTFSFGDKLSFSGIYFSATNAERKQTSLLNRSVCTDVFLNHSHIFVIFLRNSVSLAGNKCDARDEQHKKVGIINGFGSANERAARVAKHSGEFRASASTSLDFRKLESTGNSFPLLDALLLRRTLTAGQPDGRSTKWLNRALGESECPRKQKIISE